MNIEYTNYFSNTILKIKRPYLKIEWIEKVVKEPERKESQEDGRIRHWGFIPELGKYLRVVTLEDGRTVHNAFPDRNYRK